MRPKIIAFLLALVAAITIGAAAPAQAAPMQYRQMSTIQGCQDGWVCFYGDDQFGGGRYGFHVQNLYGNTCWSFPWSGQTGWPGGAVANEISSSMINRAAVTGAPAHYLHYSDDNYCSTTAGYGSVSVQIAQNSVNYITSMSQFFGSAWNDRVGSVWYT